MKAYCESRDQCRHALMLRYFGEAFAGGRCGDRCDNCLRAARQQQQQQEGQQGGGAAAAAAAAGAGRGRPGGLVSGGRTLAN